MRFSQKSWIVLSIFVLAFSLVPASQAQVNSNVSNVLLNAPLAESVTVAAGPGTVNFVLVPNGPAAGSAPVSVTASWALLKARTSVKLYAYFASGNALNDGVGDNIPNTSVKGSVNGGASNPFNTGTPYGGNFGMTVFTQAIAAANANSSHGPDTIALTIDTTGLGLPAGTYTGTLIIEAQAL